MSSYLFEYNVREEKKKRFRERPNSKGTGRLQLEYSLRKPSILFSEIRIYFTNISRKDKMKPVFCDEVFINFERKHSSKRLWKRFI